MNLDILSNGLGASDVALAANRIAVGSFFVFSGFHKLFNAQRHASLVSELQRLKVPAVGFNQWWVPANEFVGGLAVMLGFFAPLFALPLIAICLVACASAGKQVVESYKPIDVADRIDDWLYLPELLYVIALVVVAVAGPGGAALSKLF